MSDINITIFSTEQIAWFFFIIGFILGAVACALALFWFKRTRQRKNTE